MNDFARDSLRSSGAFGRRGAKRGQDLGRDRKGKGKDKEDKEKKPSLPAGFQFAQFQPTRFGGVTGAPDLMLANSPWVVSYASPAINELRILNTRRDDIRMYELVLR